MWLFLFLSLFVHQCPPYLRGSAVWSRSPTIVATLSRRPYLLLICRSTFVARSPFVRVPCSTCACVLPLACNRSRPPLEPREADIPAAALSGVVLITSTTKWTNTVALLPPNVITSMFIISYCFCVAVANLVFAAFSTLPVTWWLSHLIFFFTGDDEHSKRFSALKEYLPFLQTIIDNAKELDIQDAHLEKLRALYDMVDKKKLVLYS